MTYPKQMTFGLGAEPSSNRSVYEIHDCCENGEGNNTEKSSETGIAVIDGCGTNVASVLFALERLGKTYSLTADPKVITKASHVIIPGVSTAKRAMGQLQEKGLLQTILNCQQPVLGICSGMQILFDSSAEGDVAGMGVFPQSVNKLPQDGYPLPHMGWNKLIMKQPEHFLLNGITQLDHVYFVHSFAAPVVEHTVASCIYGVEFSAIVAKGNFYGTQFHPERSGKVGSMILNNFLQCG